MTDEYTKFQSTNSGDVGYCYDLGHSIGIIRTWVDDTVVSVDCGHQHCRYSEKCKLYQKGPIGFQRTTNI